MLETLIVEAEEAEEPSRGLWLRSYNACFPEGRSGLFAHFFMRQVESGAWMDSALSLLPEGLCPSVGQNVHHFSWYAFAQVVRDGEIAVVSEGRSRHDGALAVLAMAMRARVE